MANVTVTREELYEQVWTTPLVRLAVQYGISNVGLGKLCRRLNVPTPGRGYWARLAAGEKLKRTPLPKPVGYQARIELTRDPTATMTQPQTKPPEVLVPEALDSAHGVIRQLGNLLRKASVDEHERLVVGTIFATTAGTHRRALLVLDGLCKALETRGHAIAIVAGDGGRPTLRATAGGETVSLSMSESLDRIEHELTPAEQAEVEKTGKSRARKYDYAPGGRLRIDINDRDLARSAWADTERRRLERKLGNVVVSIEAVAEARKARRNEFEEQQRKEEQRRLEAEQHRQRLAEEQAEARRQQRLKQYRELLARDVEHMAADWVRAKQVREFLDAYDETVPDEQRTPIARRWLESARRFQAQLDPLGQPEHVPKDLDLPDEVLDQAMSALKAAHSREKKT
jgi:hypothetical protein